MRKALVPRTLPVGAKTFRVVEGGTVRVLVPGGYVNDPERPGQQMPIGDFY
jgi:hypothetical protein